LCSPAQQRHRRDHSWGRLPACPDCPHTHTNRTTLRFPTRSSIPGVSATSSCGSAMRRSSR